MKQTPLERVKKLAERLSRDDRLILFEYLARLPDSGLVYHAPLPQSAEAILPSDHTQQVLTLNTQIGWNTEPDGSRVYLFEGREVFRIKFDVTNYAEGTFEKLRDNAIHLTISDDKREGLRQLLREKVEQVRGITLTEKQVDQIEAEALRQHEQRLLRGSIEELAATIDQNLNDVALAILAKIVQTFGFAVANHLRDTVGYSEKIKVSDFQSIIYKAEFERMKTILGIRSTQGGARNVKHPWTDKDRECLATKYAELEPAWEDAKVIAREAQRSKIRNRSTKWREEVLRQYPSLPEDLLNTFATPRGGASPSENAILHAARECGIESDLTPRRLKQVVKDWKFKTSPRSSDKSRKRGNSKT